MPNELEPSTSTRRSSRLNRPSRTNVKRQDIDTPTATRRTRSKTSASKPYDRQSGSRRVQAARTAARGESASSNPSANLRRSLRISADELVRREALLLANESELEAKTSKLHHALGELRQKELEAAKMMSLLADREARETILVLEQSFLCPLCYEVFSAPHSLNAPGCGHTFCGICILKWFFSKLHGCGAWHEQVVCPMCRAEIHTPDRRVTFPFIPNRLAATTILSLTEKLCAIPANTAMLVKREESDDVLVSGSKTPRGRSCSRLLEAKTEEDELPQRPDLDGWREGGTLRTEWLKKDREAKQEMSRLLETWRTHRPADFLLLKERLGV